MKASTLKRKQLEREINESAATTVEKSNMQHSLSKLWMFAADDRDELQAQIDRLAKYILENNLMPRGFEGGAVDCAIRIMKDQQAQIATFKAAVKRLTE